VVALPSWNSIKNLPFPTSKRSHSFVYKVLQEVDKAVPYLKLAIGITLVAFTPNIYTALLYLPVAPAILTVYAILLVALAVITLYESRKALCKAFLQVWLALSQVSVQANAQP